MKGNFLKIIFILLVIGLISWAVYVNFFPKNELEKVDAYETNSEKEKVLSNTLRIGIMEFDNMNPILSNNKNVQDISRLIFDPLFTLTQDFQLEPALATEWSKLDDKTYVVKLRENVKWQDGNGFDASDVIFTIDMLKKGENHSVYSYNVEAITGIEKVDEYTIKITLKDRVPYFEYNLIFPIVSSKYFDENNFRLESKNLKPVGTGLYYISDISNTNILLKRSVTGWNKKDLKIESINVVLYPSLSGIINGFKAGEIDLFTTSNRKIEEYFKNTAHRAQTYINRKYDYIALNTKNVILENVEVRKAINSAIDKEKIVKEVYNQQYQISNFPLDFGSYAYSKENTTIAYDENVAKRLLMDAGWKYSAKKWRKTISYRYRTIELSILVRKDNGNLVKVANKLKEQLEKIGMKITVNALDTKQYKEKLKKKNYDLVLVSSNYGYSPSLYKFLGEDNLAHYENEQIDNLLDRLENIEDIDELKQSITVINETYNEDVPYISLYYNTNTLIYSTHLRGNITPNSYNLFYGIENWYREY